MVLVGLALDASAHRMVSYLADRAIDIRLVTFHGYVQRPGDAVGQAGTGCGRYPYVGRRSAKRVRPETEGHRARSRGDLAGCTRIAGLQCSDVTTRKSASPTCSGRPPCPMACVSAGRTSVTIGEPGEIRITFYPAAVDLCHEEFEQLKCAIRFEAEKPTNAPATRRAASRWYCRWEGGGEEDGGGCCGLGYCA